MEVYLIRHLKTKGNKEGRYIGSTDEPLVYDQELFDTVSHRKEGLPVIEAMAVSPMKRCRETASLLFEDMKPLICEDLREMDFGLFENRNYEELKDLPEYRQWIESRGRTEFPQGEPPEEFLARCKSAFCAQIESFLSEGRQRTAFVVHGGVIMLLMALFSGEEKDLYDWQVENCGGYRVTIERESWLQGNHLFKEYERLM